MFFTIKLYLHLNCILILNWIVWNRTIFFKMDLALNNLQRLICRKTQINKHFFVKEYLIKQYRHFCLHIFVFILSSCCINVIMSSQNWLINLPWLIGSGGTFSLVLGHHQWVCILQKLYNFCMYITTLLELSICLYWCIVLAFFSSFFSLFFFLFPFSNSVPFKEEKIAYAYHSVVRKKDERRKLNGYTCRECVEVQHSILISACLQFSK